MSSIFPGMPIPLIDCQPRADCGYLRKIKKAYHAEAESLRLHPLHYLLVALLDVKFKGSISHGLNRLDI